MKILEIRRHSIRSPSSDHLSQSGVALARLVGRNIGPFDRVVTSTIPRAYETAIAMGFAVDEQNELMNTYGGLVEKEAPWPQPFNNYADIIKQEGAAARYAKKLMKYYSSIMESIAEGRSALVITHGGVVEIGVIGCLPEHDFSSWSNSAGYCEGARLYWDDRFIRAEELRAPIDYGIR
jgi:broad specificity phosphatase PhoE